MALDIGFCIDTWDVFDSLIGRSIGKVGNTPGRVMVGEDVRMGNSWINLVCDGQISFFWLCCELA